MSARMKKNTNTKINSFLLQMILLPAIILNHITSWADETTTTLQSTTSQITTSLPEIKSEIEMKKWSVLFAAESYSNLYKEDALDKDAGINILINPAYKVNRLLRLAAKVIINKQQTGPENTTFGNTIISAGIKGREFSPNTESIHSISTILPTNQDTRDQDRLISSLNLSNGIKIKKGEHSLSYILGLAKNIHEYTTNYIGSPNIEYRLSHTLASNISITKKINISLEGIYKQGWTYKRYQRSFFEFNADVNFDIQKNLTLNIGTSNEGAAAKSNGVDSNIELFSTNTSVIRTGLSWIF